MRKLLFLVFTLSCFHLIVNAQKKQPVWDNTTDKTWDSTFQLIQVKSSADGKDQKCRFYKTSKSTPQPLIISLHTWSGDYNQEDPLAKEVALRDWNYIHPDFRGPNNNPDACGSPLVISDLEDAIRYAIKNANVDTINVHIIGVSGGGYATLLAYMKLNYPVKSFDAWAPISDLVTWYWESKGRHSKYADDVRNVATKGNVFDWNELKKRSPMYLPFQQALRKNASLNIYEGVHDGYSGSVPITHSILFYNKIAAARYPAISNSQVPDSTWMSILIKQMNPHPDTNLVIGGRKVHLLKQFPDLSLTLFEGGHEMLVPQVLALAPIDQNKNLQALNILTIGDSNGAFNFGWPDQLKKLLPYSIVINKSIAGNTIGFDNLGQTQLNTLKNIDRYLAEAFTSSQDTSKLDYLFIGLGTNDTKVIFKDRQKEVPHNLALLLKRINNFLKVHQKNIEHICFITPSPMDEQKIDSLKYGGGNERIQHNNILFKKVAGKYHIDFLDTYSLLNHDFSHKTIDGIHLNEKTQFELASLIISYINKTANP